MISSEEIIIRQFELIDDESDALAYVKASHKESTFTDYFVKSSNNDIIFIVVHDIKNLVGETHIYAFHRVKGMCIIAKYTYADNKKVMEQIKKILK